MPYYHSFFINIILSLLSDKIIDLLEVTLLVFFFIIRYFISRFQIKYAYPIRSTYISHIIISCNKNNQSQKLIFIIKESNLLYLINFAFFYYLSANFK